ncbi:PREDICTED: uncharacterized protein LOC107083358 [Cyprinodon variegatus]|uniref:uncharacterized protein LOC107083358 n=1 Tax=Cyprinodon variegatus TaxID=28743 RepID=UPI0007426F50|nr:PREDICTED: uncharacterized protein LOC107083358 [Cyprinodon variegatus]
MSLFGFILVVLTHLSSAIPLHVDAIIVQIQHWGVVGHQHVTEQVLLNGVSLLNPNQEVKSIIKSMSTHALLPAGIDNNPTTALNNHTILRSRECIIEGSRLHWADRVFYNGKVFLTLEHNDTWAAHLPEATALRQLWNQEHSQMERRHLQEGCTKLMKELKLSEEQSAQEVPLPRYLVPILAVTAFLMLIVMTILLSRSPGLRNPGGVIGSIIHYPKDMTDTAPTKKGSYSTL